MSNLPTITANTTAAEQKLAALDHDLREMASRKVRPYRWAGKYGKGAMAARRAQRHNEAVERNTCAERGQRRPSCTHNHSYA